MAIRERLAAARVEIDAEQQSREHVADGGEHQRHAGQLQDREQPCRELHVFSVR
jgi:hypothetical protein